MEAFQTQVQLLFCLEVSMVGRCCPESIVPWGLASLVLPRGNPSILLLWALHEFQWWAAQAWPIDAEGQLCLPNSKNPWVANASGSNVGCCCMLLLKAENLILSRTEDILFGAASVPGDHIPTSAFRAPQVSLVASGLLPLWNCLSFLPASVQSSKTSNCLGP